MIESALTNFFDKEYAQRSTSLDSYEDRILLSAPTREAVNRLVERRRSDLRIAGFSACAFTPHHRLVPGPHWTAARNGGKSQPMPAKPRKRLAEIPATAVKPSRTITVKKLGPFDRVSC